MTKKEKKAVLKFYIISLVIIAIGIISCESNINSIDNNKEKKLSKAEQEIIKSSDNFGLQLLSNLNNEFTSENVFISPLSVSLALGMTVNGAAGETYQEMIKALGWENLSKQEINDAAKSLITYLQAADNKVKTEIANSIWYRNSITVKPDFLTENKLYYDAEVIAANFSNPATVDVINGWIKNKTHDKIDKVIEEIDPLTVAYLINALYFKADWKYQFEEKNTADADFYGLNSVAKKCKMMRIAGNFRYHSDSKMQIVDLPYGDSLYVMSILLPTGNNNVDNMLADLKSNGMNSYFNQMNTKKGDVYLPKFKIEFYSSLVKSLKAIGMQKAFDSNADFSKMFENIKVAISDVIHKTYVEVDEKGTEAAAVTVVEIRNTSSGGGGEERFYFRADKSFLFAIRELKSNTNLFIGKLVTPN